MTQAVSGGQSEMAMSKFYDPGEGTGVAPEMTSDHSDTYTIAK